MNYFKMCGIATAAVVAAALLVAAAPASATVLCKVASSSSCGAGNQYGPGTVINSHLRSKEWSVMEAPGTEFIVHCTEST